MVVKCEVPAVDGVTIQAGCDNLNTLDSDGIVVVRIADKDTQTFKVKATKGGFTYTRTFDLSGLTVNDSVG